MANPKPPVHPDVQLIRRRIRELSRQYRYGVNPLMTDDMWRAIVKAEVFDILSTRVCAMHDDMAEHGLPARAVDAATLVAEADSLLESWSKLSHERANERGE